MNLELKSVTNFALFYVNILDDGIKKIPRLLNKLNILSFYNLLDVFTKETTWYVFVDDRK